MSCLGKVCTVQHRNRNCRGGRNAIKIMSMESERVQLKIEVARLQKICSGWVESEDRAGEIQGLYQELEQIKIENERWSRIAEYERWLRHRYIDAVREVDEDALEVELNNHAVENVEDSLRELYEPRDDYPSLPFRKLQADNAQLRALIAECVEVLTTCEINQESIMHDKLKEVAKSHE